MTSTQRETEKWNKQITESFHEYNGYIIRLRAVTYNGFWYAIIKEVLSKESPEGKKKIYLRSKGFSFIKPGELLQKAKDYIDLFPLELEKKLIGSLKTITPTTTADGHKIILSFEEIKIGDYYYGTGGIMKYTGEEMGLSERKIIAAYPKIEGILQWYNQDTPQQ